VNESDLIAEMAERLNGDRTTAMTAVNGARPLDGESLSG
jgi:hypothetical protein